VILLLFLFFQTLSPACGDARDCREQALAAASAGDYERFHDLAWRAVQKGRPNDPELMYLLARAQSLSGRPDDALVMLGRIADLGVPTDAATNPDFAGVRLLPNWPALAAKLGAAPASAAPVPSAPPAPSPVAPGAPAAPAPPSAAITFDPPLADPVGLAHDAVSRRFVLGDRREGRLVIVDEVSHHVVNYVSAVSAGFYDDLTGFAIDARRGDLWVVSAKGTADAASAVLHKLQLVSGRTLLEAPLPDALRPARFSAVAVAEDGAVYVLDSIGSRLFRLRPGTRTLEMVMRLHMDGLSALASVDARTLYVANEDGLSRVDLDARVAKPVKSVEELTGFGALAWRNGSLVGIESFEDESAIVRVRLDAAGTRAVGRDVLVTSLHRTAGTLAGTAYYYLAEKGAIRRLDLR
jgi:hypothetical protein